MGTDGIPLLLLLILCFVLSAYFAAAEMALMAMNRIRIKNHADNGDRRARRTMQVASRFEQALTTILIGSNIMNIVSTVLVTLITTRTFGAASVVWSTIAVTVFIFFFCDIIRFFKSSHEFFNIVPVCFYSAPTKTLPFFNDRVGVEYFFTRTG